jgi:hypothetical protein
VLEHAGADLRFLRGEPPTADDLLKGSELYRRAQLPKTGSITGQLRGTQVPALVSVRAFENRQHVAIAASDAEGRYRVDLLAPGSYFVTAYTLGGKEPDVAVYAGVYRLGSRLDEAAVVEVLSQRDTFGVDFELKPLPLHKVTGILEIQGNARFTREQCSVRIQASEASLLSTIQRWDSFVPVQKDGAFEFTGIPAGSYSIQASLPDGNGSRSRTADGWESNVVQVDVRADQAVHVVVARSKE